ncbi:MAG: membrane-associated protein, partial [Betaproteobacteria bacterium]|nr:membrane-associated protein [Betaproteobacteria bacterium]
MQAAAPLIPLWLKIAYTIFVVATVIIYARWWGAGNFLWFSDIALILTVPALWLENALLAGMMALATLLPDVIWIVGFFTGAVTGKPLWGLADYMFSDGKPRYVRALSLFHLLLPALLVWTIWRLGYDSDALVVQTLLAWIVLPLTYWLTDPRDNVNWVRGLFGAPQRRMHPLVYLALLMLG